MIMKEKLVELINTYVDSRLSGNVKLIEFAGTELQQFLEGVEVEEVRSEVQSVSGEVLND
jgi:hypothetical protein